MTNRVLLGALGGGDYGLRVSRPGYDVTNTSLPKEQLAFDSRWTEVSNLWMAGSATFVATTGVPGKNGSMTVSFGTTFSSPPMVLALVEYKVPSAIGLKMYHVASNLDGTTANGSTLSYIEVDTTSFTVFCASGDGNPFHYIVLRNVYG